MICFMVHRDNGSSVGIIGFIWIGIVNKPDSMTMNLYLRDNRILTFNEVPLVVAERWIMIQISLATVCACLPVYRPLLPKSIGMSARIKTWYSSTRSMLGRTQSSSTSDSDHTRCSGSHIGLAGQHQCHHYANLADGGLNEDCGIQKSNGKKYETKCFAGRDYPMNGIKVGNDVESV